MATADTVYRAELDAPTGTRKILSLLLWPVRIVAAGLGVVDETILGEVVVRRIDDGTEVMRLSVSGAEETGQELYAVREQLETLTVEEFDATWSL